MSGSSTYITILASNKNNLVLSVCALVLTRGPEKRKRIVPVLPSCVSGPLVHHSAVQGRSNSSPGPDTAMPQETPLACHT